MAYENTAGTSSVNNAYGLWRQFNSGLAKVGTYKGANINLSTKVAVPEETDWAKSLGNAFEGIFRATDVYLKKRDEERNKEVDKYLQQHSLEDYQRDIKANAVPFQDDPIAMARLKYLHGKMSYSIAKQQFEQEAINNNSLKGLSAEEIDAKAFQYFKESSKDMLEAFGYDDNDEYFRKGFYETSPEGRVEFVIKAKAVEHNEKLQEDALAETANFLAMVQAPNVTAGGIKKVFREIDDTVGVHYTPEQKSRLYQQVLDAVSNHPNGANLIDGIKDFAPQGFGGSTIRQVLGDIGWNKIVNKARLTAWTNDAQTWSDDVLSVTELIKEGDDTSLMDLADKEREASKGVLTDRYKFLIDAVKKAKEQKEVLIRADNRATEKAMKDQQDFINAVGFIKSTATGANAVPSAFGNPSTNALEEATVYLFTPNADGEAILSDDQKYTYAASTSFGISNPAKDYYRRMGNDVVSSLNNDIQKLALGGVSAAITNPPRNLNEVLKVARTVPDKFDLIFDGLSEENRGKLFTIANTMAQGVTYEQVVSSFAMRKKARSDSHLSWEITKAERQIFDLVGGSPKMDGYAKESLTTRALAYMDLGKDPGDAVDQAMKDFKTQHTEFLDTYIPNGFLTYAPEKSGKGPSSVDPEEFTDFVETRIKAAIIDREDPDSITHRLGLTPKKHDDWRGWVADKIGGLKLSYGYFPENTLFGFNQMTGTIDLIDTKNRGLLQRWSNEDLSREYDRYIEIESKKPELSIFQRIELLNKDPSIQKIKTWEIEDK